MNSLKIPSQEMKNQPQRNTNALSSDLKSARSSQSKRFDMNCAGYSNSLLSSLNFLFTGNSLKKGCIQISLDVSVVLLR